MPAGRRYSFTSTWFGAAPSATTPASDTARASAAANGGSGSATSNSDGRPPQFCTRRWPEATQRDAASGAYTPRSTAASSSASSAHCMQAPAALLGSQGDHAIEIFVIAYLLFLVYPDRVVINRGNHEDSIVGRAYGFFEEVMVKYGQVSLYQRIGELFCHLPLCAVLDKEAFIVHAGVPSEANATIYHIGAVARSNITSTVAAKWAASRAPGAATARPRSLQLVEDLLWSDPVDPADEPGAEEMCERNMMRGAGCRFGPALVQRWLKKMGLFTLVRSHECVEDGWRVLVAPHGGRLVHAYWRQWPGPRIWYGPYNKASRQLFRALQAAVDVVAPLSIVERSSIDEAYVDVTRAAHGSVLEAEAIAKRLLEAVRASGLDLPLSVGVSSSGAGSTAAAAAAVPACARSRTTPSSAAAASAAASATPPPLDDSSPTSAAG